MNTHTATYWIEQLGLIPHPEGGFYKESFRSSQHVQKANYAGNRSACTSIYYLLSENDYSSFHRLDADEIWYFHLGAPLHIHVIDQEGTHVVHELSDQASGQLSVIIPAGLWFAAEIPSRIGYTLASCAVAPGFEFSTFEMAKKESMAQNFPEHTVLIHKLCRP